MSSIVGFQKLFGIFRGPDYDQDSTYWMSLPHGPGILNPEFRQNAGDSCGAGLSCPFWEGGTKILLVDVTLHDPSILNPEFRQNTFSMHGSTLVHPSQFGCMPTLAQDPTYIMSLLVAIGL